MPIRPFSVDTTFEVALTIPVNIHVPTDQEVAAEGFHLGVAELEGVGQVLDPMAADRAWRIAAADQDRRHIGVHLVDQPVRDKGCVHLTSALDEKAFALPDKTLSDPVRVPGGWAIVRVLEKKSVDPLAFEKDKTGLMASLRQQRKDELFRAFMQETRKRFTVQRHTDAFKRVMAS